jgi:hypothetical protein
MAGADEGDAHDGVSVIEVGEFEENAAEGRLVRSHLCVDSIWQRRVKPRIDTAPGYQQGATNRAPFKAG